MPPPPAPRVLHLGRRAGVGLLLGDLGGERLGSQPAGSGGEPVQCVSEDSQVDVERRGAPRLCPTPLLFSSILPPVSSSSFPAEASQPPTAWLVSERSAARSCRGFVCSSDTKI